MQSAPRGPFGQRPPGRSTNKTQRDLGHKLGQRHLGTSSPEATPKSAARLAAEAAFAEPPRNQAAPASATQITVRRARALAPFVPLAPAVPTAPTASTAPTSSTTPAASAQASASAQQPHAKRPRVFSVGAKPRPAAQPAVAAKPTQLANPHQAAFAAATTRKPAKRRLSAQQQPGPVLLVHSAPATVRPAPFVYMAEPRSNALVAAMNGIAPLLAAVAKAQSFSVVGSGFEDQWQLLSMRAEELLRQLRTDWR